MLEPQTGLTYDEQLAFARRAEAVGLDGLYRSDHYSSGAADDDAVASTDAWAVLAGLARETSRLRIGTLVTPATFRTIGNLAKTVATVNEMAGAAPDGSSRSDLGMGTGWMEIEHERHGFDFGDLDTRFRRLEEQLDVLTRFWNPTAQPFDHRGEFVTTSGSRFHPVPEPRPRIIIGGAGMRRTPLLAARFADELNGVFLSAEDCGRQCAALDEACRQVGRDPGTISYSLMTRFVVGSDERDFRDRAARYHERAGAPGSLDDWLAGTDPVWIVGTVGVVAGQLRELAAAGVESVMAQHLLADDLAMVDLLASLAD